MFLPLPTVNIKANTSFSIVEYMFWPEVGFFEMCPIWSIQLPDFHYKVRGITFQVEGKNKAGVLYTVEHDKIV